MSKKKAAKQSNANKFIAAILAFILIAALAVSVCYNVLLYQKLSKIVATIETEIPPLDNNNVIITPIEPDDNYSVAVLSMNPEAAVMAANNNVTVPVTVTPDVDVYIAVNWTIAFSNASSEWARGKAVTDYVTVTPESEGSLKANITLYKAFGEQIIVTASVVGDSDINASCTVDYVKKYSFAGWKTEQGNTYMDAAYVYPEFTKSVGTLDDDEMLIDIAYEICDDNVIHELDRYAQCNDMLDFYEQIEMAANAYTPNDTLRFAIPMFSELHELDNKYGIGQGALGGAISLSSEQDNQEERDLVMCRLLGLAANPIFSYYSETSYNQRNYSPNRVEFDGWRNEIKERILFDMEFKSVDEIVSDFKHDFNDIVGNIAVQDLRELGYSNNYLHDFDYIMNHPFLQLHLNVQSRKYSSQIDFSITTPIYFMFNKFEMVNSISIDKSGVIF